jgi:hypothetical protein
VIEVPIPIAISIPKKERPLTGSEQRFCFDKSGCSGQQGAILM